MFVHILISLFAFFLSTATAGVTRPKKSCIDCRHFIRTIKYAGTDDEEIFAKCSLFPLKNSNQNKTPISLINYDEDPAINANLNLDVDFIYCSTARTFKDMCGDKAIYHEKRVFRKYGSSFMK